jgi:16S rRNA (cytosine1402-N4)-methyltransferase
VGPIGVLIGLDLDADNLPRARPRLEEIGYPFHVHHANFAGLEAILAEHGIEAADAILADLGMSSMQVDDAERGFSYRRDGPLDMRMDRSRGRTAADLIAGASPQELATLLMDCGDESKARAVKIASAIVPARQAAPITRTTQLAHIIQEATGEQDWRLHPKAGTWKTHPAARAFQALRIAVNREPGSLANLLRILPGVLKPGGRAAIITFHSGEDRAVKEAFKTGLHAGLYGEIADEPARPTFQEKQANPRSRSAKLRWARTRHVPA